MTPEANARQTIDALLLAAGWHVCNAADAPSACKPTSKRGWRSTKIHSPKNNNIGWK